MPSESIVDVGETQSCSGVRVDVRVAWGWTRRRARLAPHLSSPLDDDEGLRLLASAAAEAGAAPAREKSRRGDVGDDGAGAAPPANDESQRGGAREGAARAEGANAGRVLVARFAEDRKNPAAGGTDGDADVSHPGLAAAPHPRAGAELRLSVTSAGGELLMSVKRARHPQGLLSAAKAKLKLRRSP